MPGAAFSAISAALDVTAKVATSVLVTVISVVASRNPVAEAKIVTVESEVTILSSMAEMSTVTVVLPAGIVTDAGTSAWKMFDEDRPTNTSEVVGPVRVIVNVDAEAPAFSANVEGFAFSVRTV